MNWKKKFAAITLTLTSITLLIHLINRIIQYFATCKNLLTDESGQYYEWRFGNIYYEKSGEGKPLLLIHDTQVYSSSKEWEYIVEQLAKTNTVYAIDLLGCGRSEKPIITYTNFLYVQLVSDFIKQIVGEKVDIITSGRSFSIATMTALYNHDVIDKIVVSNPQSLNKLALAPTQKSKFLKRILIIPVLGTFVYNILINKYKLNRDITQNIFDDGNTLDKDTLQLYYETIHRDNTKTKYLYANIIGRYTNTNIINSLKLINNSIYIISSSKNYNALDISNQYKLIMPSIETILVDDTYGFPHLERPDYFIEQLHFLLNESE